MSYGGTRQAVLLAGLVVLLLLAGVLYVRRVDTVEVVAVLLFLPVFVALVVWDLPGGIVAGALASVAYAALRAPAMEAVGASAFTGLIATRTAGYLAFGTLGGWADRQLRLSLDKLDIYDQIDDETGLGNARLFVHETDLEMARATRYQTLFSVCVVDVPTAAVAAVPRRRRQALLRDLGAQLRAAVRTVDRVAHGHNASVHRFAVICPETGPDGAKVFVDRLAASVHQFLLGRGVTFSGDELTRVAATFPGDDDTMATLIAEFTAIDTAEHPEHHDPLNV